MKVVPRKNVDKVAFYEAHLSPWTTNAATLKVDPALLTDLDTKTTAARDAHEAMLAAQQAARAATATFNAAVKTMAGTGSAVISQIRSTADVSGDSIYDLAQIPAPAAPSPVAAPGTPYKFETVVKGDGSIKFTWKCDNPAGASGTIYQIYRSFAGSTSYDYVGGVGAREFTDLTIPVGTTQVTYKIQAIRSTAAGDWATHNVFFGSNAGGQTVEQAQPLKMAA